MPIVSRSGFKLLPPERTAPQRLFTVDLSAEGPWRTTTDSSAAISLPVGVINWNLDYALNLDGGGWGVGVHISVQVRAVDEAAAMKTVIELIERSPAFYVGFLADARCYEIAVRYEKERDW